jgi:hypothetical protein
MSRRHVTQALAYQPLRPLARDPSLPADVMALGSGIWGVFAHLRAIRRCRPT